MRSEAEGSPVKRPQFEGNAEKLASWSKPSVGTWMLRLPAAKQQAAPAPTQYIIGQEVEVLRSDGCTWSKGAVDAIELDEIVIVGCFGAKIMPKNLWDTHLRYIRTLKGYEMDQIDLHSWLLQHDLARHAGKLAEFRTVAELKQATESMSQRSAKDEWKLPAGAVSRIYGQFKKAAADKATADKVASEKASANKAAADKAAADQASAEKAPADKVPQVPPGFVGPEGYYAHDDIGDYFTTDSVEEAATKCEAVPNCVAFIRKNNDGLTCLIGRKAERVRVNGADGWWWFDRQAATSESSEPVAVRLEALECDRAQAVDIERMNQPCTDRCTDCALM